MDIALSLIIGAELLTLAVVAVHVRRRLRHQGSEGNDPTKNSDTAVTMTKSDSSL